MELVKDKRQQTAVTPNVSGLVNAGNATANAGNTLASSKNKSNLATQGSISILDQLNAFSSKVLDIGTEQQKRNAKDDAISAVMAGEYEPYQGDSPYGATFNSVGNDAYITKSKNEMNNLTLENFEKYKDNPEKFLIENSKSLHGLISKAPSKEIEFSLTESGKQTTAAFGKNLKDTRIKLGMKKEIVGLKDNVSINTGVLISQMGKGQDPTKTIEALRASYNKLADQGIISPAGVDQAIVDVVKDGQRELYLNTAAGLTTGNAKSYLKNLKFDPSYTADEKVEIRNKIKSEINSREIKSTNNTAKLVKINDDIVKDMIDVLEDGVAPSDKLDPNMMVSPKVAAKYKIASDNYNSLINMSNMTVAKQSEYLNKIDRSTPAGAKKYKYLSKQYKRFASDNLIDTAQSFGIMDGEFLDVNSSGDSFKKRELYQDQLSTKYGKQSEFFSDVEADNLKSWYSTATKTDKIKFLNNIKDLDNSQKILSEISNKTSGNLAFSGELIKTKNIAVASDILEGEALDVAPPEGLKNSTTSILGQIINRGSANDFNTYTNAAVNYSKSKVAQGITVSAEEAVQATSGKIAEYNGKKILLPMNASKAQFDSFLKNWKNDNAELQEEVNDLDGFFDGSIQLHYTGRGKYQIYYPDLGQYAAEKNKDGKLAPVELNYGSK